MVLKISPLGISHLCQQIMENRPNTSSNWAWIMDAYEFIAGGGDVEVRLFFVDEERIWYPYVLYELRANR